MAYRCSRITTEEVLAYMTCDDSSDSEYEMTEETYEEFAGVSALDSDIDSECSSEKESNEVDDIDQVETGEDVIDEPHESDPPLLVGISDESLPVSYHEIGVSNESLPLRHHAIDVSNISSPVSHHVIGISDESLPVSHHVNPYDSSETSESSDKSEEDQDSADSLQLSGMESAHSEHLSSTETHRSVSDSESNEEESSDDTHSTLQTVQYARGTRPVRARGRGRGSGILRGARGGRRGRGGRSQLQRSNYLDFIPREARPISDKDTDFVEWSEFMPLREPGPQLQDDQPATELDLLRLFISDDLLDKFIIATNAYAETKKNVKPAMYIRFKRTPLTREELLRYIGAHYLLSINSVRNFRKAWERRSSQVCTFNICNK